MLAPHGPRPHSAPLAFASSSGRAQHDRVHAHRWVLIYTAAVLGFLALMTWAEQRGLSKHWMGPIFLFVPVMLYAIIGIGGRTGSAEEYYVAGRRIPPVYNGMAAAADWVSAASFISLSGALYLQGFGGTPGQPGGLAYLLGWSGGFCLVAMLLAPHLRAMNLYTLPDYFQQRFGGHWPRIIAALATVLCSFTYLIAQIYGVGLIASRLTGVQFEIGIMLGLGGVLLCSFLGGMRAITWTQVAQYVVIFLAFLIPVSWLAYKQIGNPIAAMAYTGHLQKIAEMEEVLLHAPKELSVQQSYRERADVLQAKLQDVPLALERERLVLHERMRYLRSVNGDVGQIVATSREYAHLPRNPQQAQALWEQQLHEYRARSAPLAGLPRHSQPFGGDPEGSPAERQQFHQERINFLALMFCLMVGTAGLPHLLTRYYTVPSVSGARSSVAWTLFFVAMLYLSAPALAALVKLEVMSNLVGVRFDDLPHWIAQWSRVDPALLSVEDVNHDGVLQFGEIRLGADLIMLASAEIGGLPYVVSGLIAAGGLAAALSTADGLLLTISNACVRDLYFHNRSSAVRQQQRVIISKFVLMSVALLAAFVASQRPSDILPMVTASFSLAASAFVPAMVLGIFWQQLRGPEAVAGMVVGLAVVLYYMLSHASAVQQLLPAWLLADGLWWGIEPVSAGVFGVLAGVVTTVAGCHMRRWRTR